MDGGLSESAPSTFAVASEVLGVDVGLLCREGRAGQASLDSTRWAQPAVLTCGVAAFKALRERAQTFAAAAGHSVGEYASLVVAGAMSLADALRLVATRAEAMEEAAEAAPGGMAAVMRLDRLILEGICTRAGVGLAADNGPGQLVISGPTEALDTALRLIDEAGGVTRRLDIAGAFHSPSMAPAAQLVSAALEEVRFAETEIEVWSSTLAAPVSSPEEIRRALVEQLTGPVRWRETIEGVTGRLRGAFCDLGPGRVVGGLVKRIVKPAEISFAADLLGVAGGDPA